MRHIFVVNRWSPLGHQVDVKLMVLVLIYHRFRAAADLRDLNACGRDTPFNIKFCNYFSSALSNHEAKAGHACSLSDLNRLVTTLIIHS